MKSVLIFQDYFILADHENANYKKLTYSCFSVGSWYLLSNYCIIPQNNFFPNSGLVLLPKTKCFYSCAFALYIF